MAHTIVSVKTHAFPRSIKKFLNRDSYHSYYWSFDNITSILVDHSAGVNDKPQMSGSKKTSEMDVVFLLISE